MTLDDVRVPFPLAPTSVRWLGVLAVAAVLFYFSLVQTVPQPPQPGVAAFWDKKLHFAGYAGLGLALAYATATTRARSRRRVLFVLGGAVLYGALIELVQGPLPNRYFSYTDLLANAVGALLAIVWFLVESRLEYVSLPSR